MSRGDLEELGRECREVTTKLDAFVQRPIDRILPPEPTGNPAEDEKKRQAWWESVHSLTGVESSVRGGDFEEFVADPLWDFYDRAKAAGFQNERLDRFYRDERVAMNGGTQLAILRSLAEELCPQIDKAARTH